MTAVTKLGMTYKEAGRLTMRKFNRLYDAYKLNFDLELRLLLSRTTYGEAYKKSLKDEEWL